jgi:F-type H+-transporting ATPase subunit gamma
MSELIHMRHRMKAVKTIQKITRAMCLVSMSTHTRFRTKKEFLQNYQAGLINLFNRIHPAQPDWRHLAFNPASPGKELIILIGSQKGLCGTFNTTLFSFFIHEVLNQKKPPVDIITIGQDLDKYSHVNIGTIIQEIPAVSLASMPAVAHTCISLVMNAPQPYARVSVISNHAKTFFMQKPQRATLIPFTVESLPAEPSDDFVWEQRATDLLDQIALRIVESRLQYLIFESLLAEQAARFIAMDTATRNAHNLLTTMRLSYNKIRQAKITRELTDLIGGLF